MNRILVVLALLGLAGCSKSGGDSVPDATAVVTSASPPPSALPTASAASSAKGGTASGWSLTYTLAPSTMYIPENKDWKNAKFKNDTEKYVGEGKLTITVDADGRATGESDGPPLGNATISGMLSGDTLTAQIRRKDPTDEGLTGTLTAKIAGDKLTGDVKLAESNAAVVREGKLAGTKK